MANTLKTRIYIRNDSAASWTEKNPTLGKGEIGIELGSAASGNKIKVGDGRTAWNNLGYTWDKAVIDAAIAAASTAENTHFENDLVFTQEFGKYKPDSTGSVTIPTKSDNMSVADLLLGAFAEEKQPTIVNPSMTLTASGNASGEVGTTFAAPSATAKVATGSFEFGSKVGATVYKDTATGITFNSISVTCTNTSTTASSTSKNDPVTCGSGWTGDNLKFTDEAKTCSFSATASYPSSPRTPVTNLGHEADSTITAGTITKTASMTATGYRCWFTYAGTDATSAVDSAFIRKGTNKGNAKSAANVDIAIAAGTKRVVIALPAVAGYTKRLKSVIDVDGMGLDVIGNFTQSTISVQGANSCEAKDYVVYVAENVNGLAATTYRCTIG